MNITTNYETMIFRNEENGKVKYSASISNKKADGTYESASFPIQFNKDVELADKTKIMIKNAWMSFYNWEYQEKKGRTFFIRCNEFTQSGETKKEDPYVDFCSTVVLEGDILPF